MAKKNKRQSNDDDNVGAIVETDYEFREEYSHDEKFLIHDDLGNADTARTLTEARKISRKMRKNQGLKGKALEVYS